MACAARYTNVMKHEHQVFTYSEGRPRNVARSALRGWGRRCPNCGGGPLMDGYLSVRECCPACGEELFHHRADDMPAWATIIIVGKLLMTGMLMVEMWSHHPVWIKWVIWPAATVALPP